MRIVVTGGGGFVGRHLTAELLGAGHEVLVPGLEKGGERGGAEPLPRLDVTDLDGVRAVLQDAEFDAVAHLAALSSVGASWRDPWQTLAVNLHGGLNVVRAALEAWRGEERPRTLLLVGSAENYGQEGTVERPLSEASPLRPVSPYGGSKAALETAVIGLDPRVRVVHTRSFPHVGPGQRPPFVLADWADQLLALRENGGRGEIRVGNVSVVRDLSDVRDVARAYRLLLEREETEGVYNVCSGRGYQLSDLLTLLIRIVGVDVTVAVSEERLRAADIPSLVGSPERLREDTGWEPVYTIEDTLEDIVMDVAAWRRAEGKR